MDAEIVNALNQVFPQIVPEAILLAGACVLFLGATWSRNRHLWGVVALGSLAAAGLSLWLVPRPEMSEATARAAVYAAPIWVDALAVWVTVLALCGGAVLVLASWDDVGDDLAAEYHGCLLIIIAGVGLTAAANELVTLFLALELISIPTYVLLYLPRSTTASQEAAMKYFLLSIFSSALLLFGFSYLYGIGGTTNLPALNEALLGAGSAAMPRVTQIALVMVVAGLGFRITAVPFHFYAPDVYQGTTTSAAALLAFVPKVAGFVALARVLGYVPHVVPGVGNIEGGLRLGFALGPQVPILLWILAAVTMTLGNLLALLQNDLKRLLAYSSVAHAGYMLIGLAAAPYLYGTGSVVGGVEAVLFYLLAYGAMTIGAFAVIGYLDRPGRPVAMVDDLAGLSGSHPVAALLMALFLFSLIGMPLTAGFVGKAMLFSGALSVPEDASDVVALEQAKVFRILAVIAAVNAAVGAWYYLRIIAVMYLRGSLKPIEKRFAWPGFAAILICAAVTLTAGVYPDFFWRTARAAIPSERWAPIP